MCGMKGKVEECFNQSNIQLQHELANKTFHQNVAREKHSQHRVYLSRSLFVSNNFLFFSLHGLHSDWKTENPSHLFIYWGFSIHRALLNHSTNTEQKSNIHIHFMSLRQRIRTKKCIQQAKSKIPIKIILW